MVCGMVRYSCCYPLTQNYVHGLSSLHILYDMHIPCNRMEGCRNMCIIFIMGLFFMSVLVKDKKREKNDLILFRIFFLNFYVAIFVSRVFSKL